MIKKILLSMLAAAVITVLIPLVIVEFCQPDHNAVSTEQKKEESQTSVN